MAQVVQLLQDSMCHRQKVCCISQHTLKCTEEIPAVSMRELVEVKPSAGHIISPMSSMMFLHCSFNILSDAFLVVEVAFPKTTCVIFV